MRKIVAVFLLLVFSGSVAAFPASLEVVDKTATPDDPAEFDVKVQNDLDRDILFEAGTFSPKPSWVYVEGSKRLEPGENTSFRITVTPGEYAVDQSYSFTVYARASGQETERFQTSFNVNRDREIILEDLELNRTSYDPGQTLKGEVKVRSITSRVLRDYSIETSYSNKTAVKTSSPILPAGTRTLSFQLPIDQNSRPQTHRLNASVILESQTVEQAYQNFSVNQIENIVTNSSRSNNLATITGSVTVENKGNTPINYTVNRTVPSYLTPITGFSMEPTKVENTGTQETYYWTKELQPGEKFSVERQTNYWMPAVALLGIIAALAGLKKLRNNVKITKKAEKTGSALKVSIEIENISDRTFRDVKVEDFIPDIAEVDKNFEMASPTVRKTNSGTKLTWDLENLEPGDQRVLQYTIRPKVEVEGGLTLQEAELKEGDRTLKKTEKFDTEFSPE